MSGSLPSPHEVILVPMPRGLAEDVVVALGTARLFRERDEFVTGVNAARTQGPSAHEVRITDAYNSYPAYDVKDAVLTLASVVKQVGIETVTAIRETGSAPVPDEIVEALIPVSSAELEGLAKRNPAQAEFFTGMAAIRRGIEL